MNEDVSNQSPIGYPMEGNNLSVGWRYSSFFLFAVLLPNTPLNMVSNYFELFRPLVNFDFIIAALVVVAGFRVLGIVLLLAFMVSDIFSIVAQIFPATQQVSDLFELARFLFLSSWDYIAASALAMIYIMLVALLFFFFGKAGGLKSGLVVLNIALGFYVYHVYFESGELPTLKKNVREGPLVSSQTVNYFKYRSMFVLKTIDNSPLKKVDYAGESGVLYRLPQKNLPDRLLLIINEAWGVSVNHHINEAILKPFLERREKLRDLKYGATPFNGYTIAGELRELCSLWPNDFKLQFVETGFENCLPNRLKKEGYVTYAMHGATGQMYDRMYWYPRAGFDKQTFFESKQWPAKCLSFPGACDLDMRNEVTNFFASPGKRFMYWLTLNTHAFYNLNDLRNDFFDCKVIGINENTSTCSYLKLQAQFFYGLSEIIDDPRMAGVTVRVIGDHAPVFRKATEGQYFKEQTVGWLQFTIP